MDTWHTLQYIIYRTIQPFKSKIIILK